MKRWTTKPLGELLKVQNGFAFKSELFNVGGKGLPIIRIRDLARGYSETFYDGKHDSVFEVENGDFLIGMDGEFRCYRWQGGKALLNQRVCRLQNFSRDLNAGYVFYGINEHLRQIEDNTSFVTVKHLSSKQIANIEMPVPPLAEQKRIVKLLDEADELRKLRAQAERRTANLIPALFHEMFGQHDQSPPVLTSLDGTTAPKGWRWSHLTDVARLATGHTPSRRVPEYWEGGNIPWISLTDIRVLDGAIAQATGESVTEKGIENSSSVKLPKGTVCFSRTASVGFVTVMGREMCTSQDFVNWVCGDDLNPTYLMGALMQAREHLRSLASGSTHKTIYFPTVKQFCVLVPPLPLQKQFAQRVSEIRALLAAQAASRQRTEHLFQSMLHRAFSQEL